jgi:uncharacterized membrane protein
VITFDIVLAFIKKYYKPILLLCLIIIFVACGYYVKGLQAENKELVNNVLVQQGIITSLQVSIKVNQQALEDRIVQAKVLRAEKDAAIAALQKVFSTDAEACSWSEEPIPASVLEALGCGN